MNFSIEELPTYIPGSKEEGEFFNKASNVNDQKPLQVEKAPERMQEQAKEVIYIQGTNISLQSEEDIQKWIAERKKNWPTRRNIELKKSKQDEMIGGSNKVEDLSRKRKDAAGDRQDNHKKPKSICKFFQATGRCRFGQKCRNLHERNQKNKSNTKTIHGIEVSIPTRYSGPSNDIVSHGDHKSAFYSMLLQKEHSANENDEILQFITYLDEHKLINYNVRSI